jgi:type IV fimbrial biogenesis protein FimT
MDTKHGMHGFTLTEALIVLVIVGILAGLALPSLGSFSRHKVANQTNDLHGAIMMARSEAMKRRTTVTILPSGGRWTSGWNVIVDRNFNRTLDSADQIILSHGPLTPSTTVSADTTPGYIAFGGDGEPRRYNGGFLAATLSLCDGGLSRTLVIAKSGRTRLASGKC